MDAGGLLGVAPLVMLRPRQWTRDAGSRGTAIVLILLVLVTAFGIGVNGRRFVRDPAGAG